MVNGRREDLLGPYGIIVSIEHGAKARGMIGQRKPKPKHTAHGHIIFPCIIWIRDLHGEKKYGNSKEISFGFYPKYGSFSIRNNEFPISWVHSQISREEVLSLCSIFHEVAVTNGMKGNIIRHGDAVGIVNDYASLEVVVNRAVLNIYKRKPSKPWLLRVGC